MTGSLYKPSKFVFITDTNANPAAHSRRRLELADSAARSHAAHIIHEFKRRKKKEQRRVVEYDDSWETAMLDISLSRAAENSISDIGCGFLDPFIRLPIDYDLRQRNLLHQYITTFPSLAFAPPTTTTFSVFQNAVVPTIIKQESFANWAIFYAQVSRCQARGLYPERDALCLQYAAKAYKCLNTLVRRSNDDPASDAILAGVIGGASVQYVLGRLSEAHQHLEAGLTLCELRQKKHIQDGIDDEFGPSLNSLYVGMGVPNYFKSHAALEMAARTMVKRLLALRGWNLELRFRIHGEIGRKPSAKYIQSRNRLSTSGSIVRGHIAQLLQEQALYCQRARLGVLYAMNTVLWASRNHEAEAVEYIDDLFHYLTAGELRPYNGGMPSASIMIASDTTYFCATRAQKRCGHNEVRYDLWDVVKFVELMTLASESSRTRMNATLSWWLLAALDDAPDRLMCYAERDLDDLVDEITAGWLYKQATLGGSTAAKAAREGRQELYESN